MGQKEDILDLVKEVDPENPLQYVHDIVREYSRQKLDNQIMYCQDCPEICNNGRSLTAGNSNAAVMIIGESLHQSNSENPFDDRCQEILDNCFEILGVDTGNLFFMNTVNCWPRKIVGNETVTRTPHKKEIANCSLFIDYAIQVVQPLVIIVLGGIALNLFIKESVSAARGNWFIVKGIPTIATYHPGYFDKIEGRKDPVVIESQKEEFVDDLRRAFLYIEENYPDLHIMTTPEEEDIIGE